MVGYLMIENVYVNSRYYLTFKSTFQSEKPKKLEKTSLNAKFLIGIICILLH